MADRPEILQQLYSLARERTGASKMALAERLSDLFLDTRALLDEERELVAQLVEDLFATTDVAVRQAFAARLAHSANAPHALMKRLAGDEIVVAQPVLHYSPVLVDDDLIELIGQCGLAHAQQIARRQQVGEAVADALVLTGDLSVMLAVASNLGARLTSRAMAILSEAARISEPLRVPVMDRPELTRDQALRLYWWVQGEARRGLLQRFGIAAGQVDQALQGAVEDMLARYANARQDWQVMRGVAEWLAERGGTTPRLLIQVLRLGYLRLFCLLLAQAVMLPPEALERMIDEPGARSLAAVVRALGIDKPSYVSIFLLSRSARPGEQVVHPRELSQALLAFDRLNQPQALRLVESWRQQPSHLLGHLPVAERGH